MYDLRFLRPWKHWKDRLHQLLVESKLPDIEAERLE